MRKFVSWRRVSTKKQGNSKLGLEAQTEIINHFVNAEQGELIADYCEVYTGKYLAGCTELRKAIAKVKETGATLIIAKTDRFRNTIEALQILNEVGEKNIMFCNLGGNDRLALTILFSMAENEAIITSIRTKEAMFQKKKRGETWDRKGSKTIYLAIEKSAEVRKKEAMHNPENLFFKNYVANFEKTHGELVKGCDNRLYQQLADELNSLGKKTVKNLDYTANRCKALVFKMKKRYAA